MRVVFISKEFQIIRWVFGGFVGCLGVTLNRWGCVTELTFLWALPHGKVVNEEARELLGTGTADVRSFDHRSNGWGVGVFENLDQLFFAEEAAATTLGTFHSISWGRTHKFFVT